MRYPTLYTKAEDSDITEVMGGYNHNLRIGNTEFFHMENMSSDEYPVLSPRKARGIYARPASPQGMIHKDKLCYVDGTAFVLGDTRVEMGLSVAAEDCPKKLVSMGAYVLILPDKKWINTLEPEERGNIEATFSSVGTVRFTLTNLSGDAYENPVVSPEEPESPADKAYWIDTSKTPHTLKQFSEVSGMWAAIAATYIKISATGIGKVFSQYDGVTISGVITPEALNANMVIMDKGDNFIIVPGILDQVASQTDSIQVVRQMPYMDHVMECGNRIWGCRYGVARNGEIVNEIYASKLGDFKNWNCFMGLSTDSYTASCGTNGPFTGAVAHRGYPLFFKEHCFHKVYGSFPSAFQLQVTECRGVQKGSEKSLAAVNELLFYKSRNGICVFDGSLPEDISYPLGSIAYENAVAGAVGNKYYVSMQEVGGGWHVFVYDTQKSLWHREDALHVNEFCESDGELYAIDADRKNIITMLGSGQTDTEPVSWEVQTGELLMESIAAKYVTRLILRMTVESGTQVDIYAQYDSSPAWIHVCHIMGTALRSFSVPVRPIRCDHIRLRIKGTGGCRIYSVAKIFAHGSDRA